jgi:hypothetical protein
LSGVESAADSAAEYGDNWVALVLLGDQAAGDLLGLAVPVVG